MKNKLFLFFFALISLKSNAQEIPTQYYKLVKEATTLFSNKQFLNAANKFTEAFNIYNGNEAPYNRYNAACAWTFAGIPDSAFFQLETIVNKSNFSNYVQIIIDRDLKLLHKDIRWNQLIEKIRKNKSKSEVNLIKSLVEILDTVLINDQLYRQQISEIEEEYGRDSKEMKANWKIINEKDSINLITVKSILDHYGWLGADSIGAQGNSTLFLVIQHSDQVTQEKYLPMMRAAVKNGKAKGSSLALLEDRILLGQGKRQIYGSQIDQNPETKKYYISPLDDPENVDMRRAQVGLEPISKYVSYWDIKWDVEQYKKDLPKLEEKLHQK